MIMDIRYAMNLVAQKDQRKELQSRFHRVGLCLIGVESKTIAQRYARPIASLMHGRLHLKHAHQIVLQTKRTSEGCRTGT